MQPRQLWLVFCSENNNAKQALPDQKDSRKLEWVSWLWKKEGPLKSHQKVSRKWTGCIHTHKYVFFPLLFAFLYSEGQNCLQTSIFWFCPVETGSCHVVKRHCVRKRDPAQNSQAPKHIPHMLSSTDLSGISAQELTHITALNVINAIALKISRAKVQHQTGECSGPRS